MSDQQGQAEAVSGLRQRKATDKHAHDAGHPAASGPSVADGEDVVWGKTATGDVFRVPPTHSFLHTLLTTLTTSHLTRVTLASLLLQPAIYYLLSSVPTLRSAFFMLYFAFWRGAYDFGFGWMLRKQSEKKWIVRTLRRWGWLQLGSTAAEPAGKYYTQPGWSAWWKRELEAKLGPDYSWDAVPQEFNAWIMFRQLVDVVLLNDFLSYSLFAIANLHFPPTHSVFTHVLRWVIGWTLIVFNLWVKIDAHRVVKDYAWYWGDAFWLIVQQRDLVFDGVYEIAPHPMYSVGYAGYYGLSLVTGSYTVFFVSLAAHAAQFAFLLWFENPHIERTYGGDRKPLVQRQPVIWEDDEHALEASPDPSFHATLPEMVPIEQTPAATDGETDAEPELQDLEPDAPGPRVTIMRSDSTASNGSFGTSSAQAKSSTAGSSTPGKMRRKSVSMHDLTNRFFRKPVVVLSNLDVFRANDFTFCLLMAYVVLTSLSPTPGPRASLVLHFAHALIWRVFHSYGLGLLLRAQSKSKWLVRHFLKHYHYPIEVNGTESEQREGVVKRATEEAFGNWQVAYNVSLVMTYISFGLLAWKTYSLPSDWTVSGTILRHTLGLLLIALHLWAAVSSFEVLGDFGWLYADFFLLEQCPSRLAYTGIYRFLNNPERSMGGAAFLGLSLICGSKLVFTLAVFSQLSHWWFLSFVENPHMKSLYGDRLRKDGGLTKTLKSVAEHHARKLESRAGKHAPEIKRVVQEVKGTIDKVEERLAEAVEEFLGHARPMVSGVVQDTKVLLQQSRERMIITRVASDLSSFDAAQYKMALPSGSSAAAVPRFHVGQPIRVSWTAPAHHSRKDWIGIYRLGSCKSQLVTRISSMGKWMPLYEEEWDGDHFLDAGSEKKKGDAGEVVFSGEQLPWTPGQYELRLHHDGKHNVMTRVAPIEIFVTKPVNDSYPSVHQALLNIVRLSLDADPALVPRAVRTPAFIESLPETDEARNEPLPEYGDEDDRDPDDFVVMEERQAKRIAALVETACGVELSTEVVIADANVGALTRRVIGAKSLVAKAGGRPVG